MQASIASAILAYLAVASAQGVTSIISAPGSAPSTCATSQAGVFGIQIVQAAGGSFAKRQVTQIGDGQIQATSAAAAPVSQITDGQIQAATAVPVTQITDGQIQAATAVPVTQISDGQIQGATAVAKPSIVTVTVTKNNCVASPITQISDGQIQAPMATPVTQISDGQIQAATGVAVSQITDGQIQAPTGVAVSQITDGQIQAATGTPVSQITDGQIQAATGAAVSQITDGQIQAATGTPVAQITDGQVQGMTTLATSTKSAGMSVGTSSAGYAMLPGTSQACASSGTLEITLANSVLTDSKNRTGYVAANYQFQFDDPPQTGAIYTAGWSLCSNGTLALGSSTLFYQCLSGTFYNLYFYPSGETIPPQCEAVQIEAIQLNSC